MSADLFDEYVEGRIALPLNRHTTDRFSMQLNDMPCFDDDSMMGNSEYCVTMFNATQVLSFNRAWGPRDSSTWQVTSINKSLMVEQELDTTVSSCAVEPSTTRLYYDTLQIGIDDYLISVDGKWVGHTSQAGMRKACQGKHVLKFKRSNPTSFSSTASPHLMLRDAVERALWESEQLMLSEVKEHSELQALATKKVTDPILVAVESQAQSLSDAQTSIDLLRGEVANLKQYIMAKALSHSQEIAEQKNILAQSEKKTDSLRRDFEILRMQFNTFSLSCHALEVVHDPF
jgi:hypothetical protein